MVNLKIDNIPVSVPEGTTILEAARSVNIEIPTLCYLKGMNEIAACRICCVELVGHDRLIPACDNVVAEGMEVLTNSHKVREARRSNLRLLLSHHDVSCTNCTRSGNCTLQSLANDFNMRGTHYPKKLLIDKADITAPLIRENNKCVMCMRCIQICEKVQTVNIWDLLGTGSRAMVLIGAAAVIALPLVGGWLGRKWRHRHGRRQVLVLGGAGLAGLVLVLWIAMGWMRVDRMEQGRSVMAAATTALAVEAMPAGIGAGAFVPWFDAHIPEPMLQYNYINHAHNEYLQWWLEGGVAGLAWSLLLLAGFIWACPRPDARGHRPDAAWVGSWLGVACLLAHSVVDYPMRTPALATAGAWMAAVAIASRLRQRQRRKTEQARPDPSPSVPVSPRP